MVTEASFARSHKNSFKDLLFILDKMLFQITAMSLISAKLGSSFIALPLYSLALAMPLLVVIEPVISPASARSRRNCMFT